MVPWIRTTATATIVMGLWACGQADESSLSSKNTGESSSHWSFRMPERPAIPIVQNRDWVKNPIDHFILETLEQNAIKPSPQADSLTLIRHRNM